MFNHSGSWGQSAKGLSPRRKEVRMNVSTALNLKLIVSWIAEEGKGTA